MAPDMETRTDELRAAERRAQIAQMVLEQGRVLVADLVDQFQVTETSIRRDLTILEGNRRLRRIHGGAIPASGSSRTGSFADKQQLHVDAKARIGKAAANLIMPNEVILFDSGTTPLQVVNHIRSEMRSSSIITLVSNSQPIAHEVLSWPSPNLTILGGLYLPDYRATVGPQTAEQLEGVTADKVFLGADGLTVAGGPTTANVLIAEVARLMVEHARQVILVADSSKIGRAGFVPITPVSSLDLLITDRDAPAEVVHAIRDAGVEVLLV